MCMNCHKTSVQSIPIHFLGTVDYSSSIYCVFIISQKRVVDTHNVIFNKRVDSHPPDDWASTSLVTLSYTLSFDGDDELGPALTHAVTVTMPPMHSVSVSPPLPTSDNTPVGH